MGTSFPLRTLLAYIIVALFIGAPVRLQSLRPHTSYFGSELVRRNPERRLELLVHPWLVSVTNCQNSMTVSAVIEIAGGS